MWYIVVSLVTIIYILIYLMLPSVIDISTISYIIRPILWISLAISVFLISRQEGLNIWSFKKIRKWSIGRSPFEAGLLIAGFQISLLIIAGLFFGLGKSPYSFTPFSIIINIIFISSMLFGVELSRSYLIKKGASTKRNVTLTLGIVTILFVIINIPLLDFTILQFNDPTSSFKFLGGTIVTLLAMGLFASYLSYVGGAMASIGYMGALQAFEWFSPVLPDFNWALMALIGTLAPAIGFLIIQNSIQVTSHGKKKKRKKDPALSWTGVSVLCVLMIFFSFGYLGVQPTIIYSGSMRPSLDVGDIVIILETPIDDIKEGDIIQYRSDNISIIHRVYEIQEKSFITKGDANNNPDSHSVYPNQITGKSIFTIPKLGWISIALKSFINKIT